MKINLLRNRGDNTGRTAVTRLSYESAASNAGEFSAFNDFRNNNQKIINNVLLMFIGVGCLMAYEYFHIGGLESDLAALNSQNSSLQAELTEKRPIAEKAKVLQKEIQDIESRIKSIKDLSKIRLREIRAVDYIQNTIPERVWLTKVEFNSGNLTLEGGASSDEQLNRFLESLEAKSYFTNVILLKSIEEKAKEGIIKRYEISSSVTSSD
jgi:Tfp pilus assembly protein PilN